MFIAINGQLGSGKSELCRRLEADYGYDIFHTGRIQREFAQELGISIMELNELCKSDRRYDNAIDGKLVEYAEKVRGTNVVFDSRMAWHFVKDVFKVHLLISPDIAADRVYGKREAVEETYASKDAAMRALLTRAELENARYKDLYNVTLSKYRNYDLILDTSLLTVQEEVDIITSAVKEYKEQGSYKGFFSSPVSLYPADSDFSGGGDEVNVVKRGMALYVISGLHKVRDAVMRGARSIAVNLVAEEGEEGAEEYLERIRTDKAILSDWEAICGFRYGYVPDEIKSKI